MELKSQKTRTTHTRSFKWSRIRFVSSLIEKRDISYFKCFYSQGPICAIGYTDITKKEPGSSGSIVSDYGLDELAIGVRSPSETKDFSCSLCVQTSSGAHPASCTMGTGGPFPGGKARSGRDADHSPHLVTR
jgi:hypothetical protein